MMTIRNTSERWGAVTKALHWTIALCIFTAMATAILNNQLLADVPWQRKLASQLMDVHRSCGVTALFLGVVRIVWTLTSLRPALPDHLNDFDRQSVALSHRLIYGLAILTPLAGWLATAAFGTEFRWFGLFTVPNPIAENRPLVAYFYHSHWILYHALLVLVILHVGAACWHQFSQKDNILARMLPFYRGGGPRSGS